MSNLGLYAAAVLIWGSTWLVIKFQLGVVSPVVSVAWRFALAAVMLLAYSALRRRPLIFSARDHLWIALQGMLMLPALTAGDALEISKSGGVAPRLTNRGLAFEELESSRVASR